MITKSPITLMTLEDLPEVTALSAQLGYPASLSDISERFKYLTTLPNHTFYVCKNEGKVLGWVHLEAVDDLIEEKKVEIKAIVVDEAARGQGVGHNLILKAREWAREQNLQTVYLSCNIKRLQTHQFYLKEGFTQSRSSHFFEIQA